MLILAGAGLGNVESLTVEVYREIQRIERVIAFGRVAEKIREIKEDIIEVSRVNDIISLLQDDVPTLVLASGDPMFFGIHELIKREGFKIDKVMPGISSMQGLFSRIKISWSDFTFISLHGREFDLSKISAKRLFFLTDLTNNPISILKSMEQLGCKGTFYIGCNLGDSEEKIVIGKIGDEIDLGNAISVMAVILDD